MFLWVVVLCKAEILNACIAKSKRLFVEMENSLVGSISGRTCGFQKAVQKNVAH